MTQFSLAVKKNSCASLKTLKKPQDSYLLGVAETLLPSFSFDTLFVIDVNGKDIDYLMLDSQRAIIDGVPFENTTLYMEVEKIVRTVDEIIFWYGSDFQDLDYVCDVPSLLAKLEKAVRDSTCELYVHYRKNSE